MIIVGYQGIGKSTLAKKSKKYIDLESSIFFHEGARPDDWYIYYCKVAENLSSQGYIVFVSSHKQVRDYLLDSGEHIIIICPSLSLKDEWIMKLEQRYNNTLLIKDFKAWQNANETFEQNIKDIYDCGLPVHTINDMNYNLKKIIKGAEK